MKKTLLLAALIISSIQFATGQIASITDGDWNDPNTWDCGCIPTSSSGTITIAHNILVPTGFAVTVDQLSVNPFVTLTVEGTFTLSNGTGIDLDIYNDGLDFGSLVVNSGGIFERGDLSTIAGTDQLNTSFNSGSIYRHLYTTTEGDIPTGNWAVSSRLEINGYTVGTSPLNAVSTSWGQTFGDVHFNSPIGSNKIFDFSGLLTSIAGELRIISTGSGRVQLSTTQNPTINIGTDLQVLGTSRLVINTAGAGAVVNVGRDFIFSSTLGAGSATNTSGTTTINIARHFSMNAPGGSINLASGSGTGRLNVTGDFSLTAGTLTETSTGNGNINFVGSNAVHTFTKTGTIANTINYDVASNNTLNLGTSTLTGSGTFTLRSNAVLGVGSTHTSGALQLSQTDGNLLVSGTRTFEGGSRISYVGTGAQFIGDGHPNAASTSPFTINTTVDNASGVSLVGNRTISGSLTLGPTAGSNLTIGANTLTLSRSVISSNGNSIVLVEINGDPVSNLVIDGSGAFGTLTTSGSTSINDFTLNRGSQTVTLGSNLTIEGTFAQSAGNLNYAGRTLTIANNYSLGSPGGNITGDASSTFIVTGIGTISTLPLTGTIGTLEINKESGAANTTSVTVTTALRLLGGVFGGTGAVTLSPGITITRGDGSTTKTFSVTNYNLVYTNGAPITTANELIVDPSTALQNLTIAGANTVTLAAGLTDLTINGTLTMSNGEFNTASKPIFLLGNVVSNATGTFTNSLVTFSGNTTISGGTAPQWDDIRVASGATLNWGTTVNSSVSGDLTLDAGGTMVAGSRTTTFNGSTTISLPDVATVARFHNLTLAANSTLIVTCTDCGSENSRPSLNLTGNWNTSSFNSTFTPAPNDDRTSVVFSGSNMNISMLTTQPFWDLTVGGSGSATLATNIAVANDLVISGTKNLTTSASNFSVAVGGDMRFSGGTFTPNLSTVTFNGTGAQSIDSGVDIGTFYNITVNKAGGSFTNLANVQLQNIFTLSSNTAVNFAGTGSDSFTLLSTATRTASIGPILSPALTSNITGNVIAQRFMHGEGQIYRYISSPVATSASALLDDFPITGTFTGNTTCPTFQPGARNMYSYNEALAGNLEAGYVGYPVSNISEALVAGRGYAVQMCVGGTPITWDVTGPINSGNIPLTLLSFTNNASSADGFNLVGNPYPSPIDWADADWIKSANISSTIYIRDNGLQDTPAGSTGGGVYTTFNSTTGIGTNGGSKNIAVGQAFWVQVTSNVTTPVLTATEGVKLGAQPTFFREKEPENYFRITLSQGTLRDEAVIHLRDDGTDGFDPMLDAKKMMNDIFSLSTFNADSALFAVNTVKGDLCTKEFGVDVANAKPGVYALSFSAYESFANPISIYLIDNFTNQSVLINQMPSYEFTVNSNPLSGGKGRFKIVTTSGPALATDLKMETLTSCEKASVQIESSQKDALYQVAFNGNLISSEVVGTGGDLSIVIDRTTLSEGENSLMVFVKKAGCAPVPMQNSVKLVNHPFYVPQVTNAIICQEGSARLLAAGKPESGSYRWYDSPRANTPIAQETTGILETPVLNENKSYFVSIVNALGCEGPRIEVLAQVEQFNDASITVEGDKLISNYTEGNQWLLDGIPLAGATGKELLVSESGNYSLEVSINKTCKSIVEFAYVAEGNFSKRFSVFPNPTEQNAKIHVQSYGPVEGSIRTVSGIEIGKINFTTTGIDHQADIDLSTFGPGVFIIQVKEGNETYYKKLIKR